MLRVLMRIAIGNTLYPPLGIGGAERSVQFLAEALVKRGHEVAVVSQGTGLRTVREEINGVHVVRVGSLPGYGPNIYAHRPLSQRVYAKVLRKWKSRRTDQFLEEIRDFFPDILHTNSVGSLGDIWSRAADAGIPVVHTLRNHSLLCDRRMFVEGRACEGMCSWCPPKQRTEGIGPEPVAAIVGISNYILQEHLTSGYFSRVRLRRIIPNSFASDRTQRRRRGSSDTITFGYLGRLHETKGVEQLVIAMRDFRGRAELIIGGTGNPVFVKRLKKEAPDNVQFVGFVKADDLLTQVDALVVPSLWREPFGRIYAESMVHGVPVLGSTYGAGPELVQDDQTGWLCDPASPRELRRGLERALSALQLTPNRFREPCRDQAARYDPDVVAQQYESVFADARQTSLAGAGAA